jgi:glyoxylase-like metal-dependent hydrolase (beta-lactamase superfamily II)
MPDKLRVFKKKLGRLYIHPEEIKLIVLTHSHFDHVGSAKPISEFTGAKVIIHEMERYYLENKKFDMIKGVGSYGNIMLPILMPYFKHVSFPDVKADIYLNQEEFPLNDFGVDGKILHTPGHTQGSLSVLLNTGEAFVGCLAHNGFPFRLNPGFPIFAQDIDLLKQSWRMLIEKGAKVIFPGHGKPFSVEVIKRILLS